MAIETSPGDTASLALLDTRCCLLLSGNIKCQVNAGASYYQVNRFLKEFSYLHYLFRRLLQDFFLWRLKVIEPKLLLLDLDTMVMDNETANKREGVKSKYKNVTGFPPLQLSGAVIRQRWVPW